MREYILMNGSQIPVDAIDRGPLMLWDREVWLSRYVSFQSGHLLYGTIPLAAVLIFAVVTQIMVLLVIVPIICCWAGYTLALRWAARKDLDRGGAVPGIYKWGVEMPSYPLYLTRLFIPWDEIEGVWAKRAIIASDTVYISIHDSRWRWRFPKVMMGDEGLALAIAMVGASRPAPPEPEVVPPRLIVYTSEGVSKETYPEGP